MDKKKKPEELIIAEKEIAFQNEEKEKRAAELIVATNGHEYSDYKRMSTIPGSEESLNFFIENVKDYAIIFFDINGNILTWNSGAQHIKLYQSHEIIGKNFSVFFTETDQLNNKPQLLLTRAKLDGHVEDEGWRVKKDGTLFWESVTIISLRKKDGTHYGFVKITHDLTERKQAEENINYLNTTLEEKIERTDKLAIEILNANKELVIQNREKEKRADELIIANKELAFQNEEKGKRAVELIVANKELVLQNREKEKRADELIIANKELAFQNEEKRKRADELVIVNKELAFQVEVNKVLEQFTFVVSHNLQEPLRTVSNYLKVFDEDYSEILDDNARKYLQFADDSTKRMSTLLNSLADISRLGRNIKLSKVDCKKIIDEVIADLKSLIKSSNSKIEVTEMPMLNVYEVEMRQLFQNLITNAIKFQKKNIKPEIQIRSENINDKWKFSVSDNGIGIAPVHFERIFDIFQRLHTDEEYEGNGIGLSNCKKIVQLHHGEIWIESNLGQGSTFYFTIPNLTL